MTSSSRLQPKTDGSSEAHQESAKIEAQNKSGGLGQSIAYAFDKVELVLLDAQGEMSNQISTTGFMDNMKVTPILSSLQMRVPDLASLRATDAEGMILHGHGMPTGPPINVSDDSHFPYLRDHPNTATSTALRCFVSTWTNSTRSTTFMVTIPAIVC